MPSAGESLAHLARYVVLRSANEFAAGDRRHHRVNGATGGTQEGRLFWRLHHAQLPNGVRGEAHLRCCAAACKRRLNAQDEGCPESVRDRNANC